jgi:hypothetical protein
MVVSRRVGQENFIAGTGFLYTGRLKTGNVKHIVESPCYSHAVTDKKPDERQNNVQTMKSVHRVAHKL